MKHCFACWSIVVASLSVAPVVPGQETDAAPEEAGLAPAAFAVDPVSRKEAETLFEEMVKAYRQGPLRDAFTLSVRLEADGERYTERDDFEFLFDNDGRARLDLEELQIFIPGDNWVYVLHDDSPDLYFKVEYQGELSNDVFLDNFDLFPFPQLPLVLAEDALWEFFMLAPLEVKGCGVQTIEDTPYRTLVLEGSESAIALRLDPETKLMHWLQVEFKGTGSRQRTMIFEMEPTLLEEVDAAEFAVDLAGREQVEELYELEPKPAEVEMEDTDPSAAMVGRRLPSFHLPDLDGELVDSVVLGDQALVLDLWASWCGPCRKGLPFIDEAATQAAALGLPVRFYAVNVREKAESEEARMELVRTFWEEQGFRMSTLIDHASLLADDLQVGGIPCTVIVRPDGLVHAVHVGLDTSDPEAIVPRLLDEIRAAIEAAEEVEIDPF